MNIGQITSGQVATSVWANATRTLTDYAVPTTSEDSGGIVVVAAGNGVKGSWVQLLAATAAQVKRIILVLGTSSAQNFIVDIGTGAAASEVVKISNIAWQESSNVGVTTSMTQIDILIPAGTRIAARAQGTAAVNIGVGVTFLE